MKYIFSYTDPQKHLLDITFIAAVKGEETLVRLPAWRPGRYELTDFAKYVKGFTPKDEKGNNLSFHKTSKDCWAVKTNGVKELHLTYTFYANILNAGSTYLDEEQLYVNPVNCCVYIPERINESCTIELKVPNNYQVACSLPTATPHKKREDTSYKHALTAADYHELADSPFIASASIKHNVFFLDGVEFNLWFQGECKPNWPKIINDFFIFINEQFVSMKGPIPTKEYHFIFQILPTRIHHGVEHLASTVIALGPSYDLMQGDLFLEFLSVSSHELYHAWNVKAIRPIEMYPYDYTKQNYSRLGYVCEGVTTYYGDFFLYRSSIYTDDEYFKSMQRHLHAHFDNFGRYNLSVADSSFDTWLDGYGEIMPHRKTSIYSEGCMLAWMTDLMVRRYTKNERSLDDVMQHLYKEFAQKNKGYSEADYQATIELVAGHSFKEFFDNYVNKASSYENALNQSIEYIGLQLVTGHSKKHYERYYGIKIVETNQVSRVVALYPNSIAEKAGVQLGDDIVSINGITIKNNLAEWSNYFSNSEVDFIANNNGKTRAIHLPISAEEYYKTHYIQKSANATEEQKINFGIWSKRKW